jgi:hypothetical protein
MPVLEFLDLQNPDYPLTPSNEEGLIDAFDISAF